MILKVKVAKNIQIHSGYPETLIITSEGPAAETFPSQMGVYRMTNLSHSGRPVWWGRNGSILYNGESF